MEHHRSKSRLRDTSAIKVLYLRLNKHLAMSFKVFPEKIPCLELLGVWTELYTQPQAKDPNQRHESTSI